MTYNPENFFISKDLKNYTPGKYSIPISSEDVPMEEEEMEIVKSEPVSVDIEIKVKGEKAIQFKNVPIKILESPSSIFGVNLERSEVSVELVKTEEYISKLDVADIMVFLNVSELKEGTYQLPLQIKIPQGVKLVRIEPNVVKVTLERYPPLDIK